MLFYVLGDKVLPWLLVDERKHKDVNLRFNYWAGEDSIGPIEMLEESIFCLFW